MFTEELKASTFLEGNLESRDVYFLIDEGKQLEENENEKSEMLGPHKVVLSTRSEVFKAQFFGGLKEESNAPSHSSIYNHTNYKGET